MMHPSTMKLVDRLCAMTAQGKIKWAMGEDDHKYIYSTEGYSVVLQGEPTSLQLTDTAGKELERVTAEELEQTPHSNGETYAAVLATLLTDASRHARGTESAISSVLEGLDLDGDGVVDIPMENGLVPTPAEGDDPAPDTVEDNAGEFVTASQAEADVDVEGMSNAVASLADQVNLAELSTPDLTAQTGPEAATTDAAATEPPAHEPVAPAPTATQEPSDEQNTMPISGLTGLTAAGLGAVGLVKAAQSIPEQSDEGDAEALSSELPPEDIDPAPAEADMDDHVEPVIATEDAGTNDFALSGTSDEPPLKLYATTPEQPPKDEFVPPEPGQFLSLSGLGRTDLQDKPIMAGTATVMPNSPLTSADTSAPLEDAPEASGEPVAAPAQNHLADTPAPAAISPEDVRQEPVQPDTASLEPADPEPVAPQQAASDPVNHEPAEEQTDETPARNSRFNPWI